MKDQDFCQRLSQIRQKYGYGQPSEPQSPSPIPLTVLSPTAYPVVSKHVYEVLPSPSRPNSQRVQRSHPSQTPQKPHLPYRVTNMEGGDTSPVSKGFSGHLRGTRREKPLSQSKQGACPESEPEQSKKGTPTSTFIPLRHGKEGTSRKVINPQEGEQYRRRRESQKERDQINNNQIELHSLGVDKDSQSQPIGRKFESHIQSIDRVWAKINAALRRQRELI